MSLTQLIILSIVQGLTEWLPISSSAHLILFPAVTGLPDQGPLIDGMAHLGSLGAVFVYFRKDIARMFIGAGDLLNAMLGQRALSANAKLLLLIIIATPPGLMLGGLMQSSDAMDALRDTSVIATSTIVFGVFLWMADTFAQSKRTESEMTWKDGLLIGVAQAMAFIPGASRSGTAMTAARALGLKRDEAARFGMLAGIPLIAAIGLYALLQLAMGESPNAIAADGTEVTVTLMDGLIVAVLSFLAAWASVAVLMALVKRMSFLPFVLYRLALGGLLFAFAV